MRSAGAAAVCLSVGRNLHRQIGVAIRLERTCPTPPQEDLELVAEAGRRGCANAGSGGSPSRESSVAPPAPQHARLLVLAEDARI
mmetsp:Transcript_109628/g.274634  ORF Transcript_109628/g.274634 Transcript_109628/m.274634 type:complete len:85 (+) Transcript_109628:171-425(+)